MEGCDAEGAMNEGFNDKGGGEMLNGCATYAAVLLWLSSLLSERRGGGELGGWGDEGEAEESEEVRSAETPLSFL